MRAAFIFSLCFHLGLVGVSSILAPKVKMQPTFYAVALLQEEAKGDSRHRKPRDIKVQKVKKKVVPAVRKEAPPKPKPKPKTAVAVKPETAHMPEKREKSSPAQKENNKARHKEAALDYKDVQKAIAQIHQKEARETIHESLAEIQKRLLEENENAKAEHVADERVNSSSQRDGDGQESELYRTRLWNLIHSRWLIFEAGFDNREYLESRVLIRLARDGSIQEVKLVKSSGDPMFDNCAVLAIKRVGKFPPFPPEIAMESEEFEVSFVPR